MEVEFFFNTPEDIACNKGSDMNGTVGIASARGLSIDAGGDC
jgi:hypothetical protein